MENVVKAYFFEKYREASFRVVPGHWPDFKGKAEVDKWIADMEKMVTAFGQEIGKAPD